MCTQLNDTYANSDFAIYEKLHLCNAGYTGPNDGPCLACTEGKYKASIGSSECVGCAVGTYTSATARTECTACAPGTYANATGRSACTPCAPGTFTSNDGSSRCADCAQNTIANASRGLACTPCAFGTYTQTLGGTSCLDCALVTGGSQNAPILTPRPSTLVPLFTPDGTTQSHTPRAKISPNQHCLAVLLDYEDIRDKESRVHVLVLGARSGTRSKALTFEGAGSFVDFTVTDAALHAVFAGAHVSVASILLDGYCRPGARSEEQYPTANQTVCNGSSVVFAGAADAFVLLCDAENTSTVAGALALNTSLVQPWPHVGAGVPRLLQFLARDGENTSFAVHYAEAAQARLLAQDSTGAFVQLRALESHEDHDWAYAGEAVRAATGAAGGELLFLPGEFPRVAEFFANGSARAWQLRGCFEYELSDQPTFAQTHAHALLFARADCDATHELVHLAQGCASATVTVPQTVEFYVHGDLGFVNVTQCNTHQLVFVEAEQTRIFNNSSPQRKLCAQSIACEYGSVQAAGDATQCVCRAGFYSNAATGGCEACAPGTFSNVTEAQDCAPCPDAAPFSHRASTSARSCFAAYGISTREQGVLDELTALAHAARPTADTVSTHMEAGLVANVDMSGLRDMLGAA